MQLCSKVRGVREEKELCSSAHLMFPFCSAIYRQHKGLLGENIQRVLIPLSIPLSFFLRLCLCLWSLWYLPPSHLLARVL